MSLDNLIKVAERKGVSKEALIKRIQEKYKEGVQNICHSSSSLADLKALKKITGIKAEIPENIVEDAYFNSAICNGLDSDWADLEEITGIKPSEKTVQKLYEHWFHEKSFYPVREIIKITKIMPLNEVIQKTYSILLAEGSAQLDNIEELRKATGIAPDPAIVFVQEACLKYAEDHYSSLVDLQKRTGITLPEPAVQKRYAMCIDSFNKIELQKLKEITRIESSEDIIQEAYAKYVRNWRVNNLSSLSEWEQITGVKLAESTVQAAYLDYVREGWFGRFIELNKLTGVKPILSANVVQKAYTKLIKTGDVSFAIELKKSTGVEPVLTKRTVLGGYISCMIYWHIDRLKELALFLGELQNAAKIRPSEKSIQDAYLLCLNRCLPSKSKLKNAEKILGINVSERTIQEVYKHYVKRGRLYEIPVLQKIVGVEPSEEVWEVLCNYLFSVNKRALRGN